MAKQRISSEQIGQAYAYGTVGGELVDGLKSLSLTDSLNVTTKRNGLWMLPRYKL